MEFRVERQERDYMECPYGTMDRDVNAARNILLRNLPFLID